MLPRQERQRAREQKTSSRCSRTLASVSTATASSTNPATPACATLLRFHPIIFGDSSEKRICIPNLYPDLGLLLSMTERRSGQSHHLTQDQVQGGTSLMLRIIMLRIIMQSSAADNDVVQ